MASTSKKTLTKRKFSSDDLSSKRIAKQPRRQTFLSKYSKEFPCLKASKVDRNYAFCIYCNKATAEVTGAYAISTDGSNNKSDKLYPVIATYVSQSSGLISSTLIGVLKMTLQ